MSIYYDRKKINRILEFVLILVLVLALAYGLGVIALGFQEKSPITITYQELPVPVEVSSVPASAAAAVTSGLTASPSTASSKSDQMVVASKKGTKYHLPTCSGAKTISAENKITFPNAKAAEKAGYGPAKNCKGLVPQSE